MADSNTIESLCREHTKLSEEDIVQINELSKNLQLIADLAQANIFIDCLTRERHQAVVVAEAVPETVPSLYSDRVVGKFAYDSLEPAVFLPMRRENRRLRSRPLGRRFPINRTFSRFCSVYCSPNGRSPVTMLPPTRLKKQCTRACERRGAFIHRSLFHLYSGLSCSPS